MRTKRFILALVVMILMVFAVQSFASTVLTCPSTVSKYYDRAGNAYTPTSAGKITLSDTTYLADFLNAGCYFSYPSGAACGTSSTCAATNITNSLVIAQGQATMSSASITITGLPFTSSLTYTCTASDVTAANAVKITNVSGASITLAGTGNDVVNYICVGY